MINRSVVVYLSVNTRKEGSRSLEKLNSIIYSSKIWGSTDGMRDTIRGMQWGLIVSGDGN